ncbi:MAG: hypothetical protein JWR63_1744, partial [Conexibacter sp.]|nr:hypothetical protein [Conexibacter sp.]
AGVALGGDLAGSPVGPVLAAAGQGAVAAAWRLDKPRKYESIAALAADPGGALSTPVVVSPADADGVRHPAVAVGAGGDAVLAYNTNTRAVHLSMRGAIAISLRAHGQGFGEQIMIDRTPSTPPAVAIADDGRGVVAWTRLRRVWAVSFDAAAGTVGDPKAVSGAGPVGGIAAAAGPDGAATIAWRTHRRDGRFSRYQVQAVHRAGGAGAFGRTVQTVAEAGRRGFIREVRLVADEEGLTTLAWAPETFGSDHNVGINGVTATVQSASLDLDTGRFGRPAIVAPARGKSCFTPALAARAGVAVAAWECRDRTSTTVDYARLSLPRTAQILSTPLRRNVAFGPIAITIGLDTTGTATITTTTATQPDATKPLVWTVLATTGR